MDLRTYLHAFRKSWLLLALFTLFGFFAGAVAYRLTPPVYSSSVTFYVSTPPSVDSSPLSSGQFAQGRVSSYVALLQSQDLAQRVISAQGLSLTPSALAKQITASAELNTVLVTTEVKDSSANRSLSIAQGIAKTFGAMVDQLDNQGRKDKVVVINVVSGPSLAPYAISPSRKIYGGLGLLLGLGVGALIAILREFLDTTVRTNETAAALVHAPVLSGVEYEPGSGEHPLLLAGVDNPLRKESFRQLRTNLQLTNVAESASVIMVTSAVPQEGKSFTALNLALSFVGFGENVLLVETDLRKPVLAEHLGVDADLGLTKILSGQCAVEDAIQPWGADGLRILPSGSLPSNPPELLGGKQMASLMTDLRLKFDRIILDTPATLPVADAAVCSALADGVVLVIRWGRTHGAQVTAAVRALTTVKAPILGSVLNMRKATRAEKRRYASESYDSREVPVTW